MTSQAFEVALSEPDELAARSRLHALITAGKYTGNTLPSVAEKYLLAFCDKKLPFIRRRWVGVALAGMIGSSEAVVQSVQELHHQLQDLGDTILSKSEREEIKIVAGVVIRQALAQGLDFCSFWAPVKVKDNAQNFPRDANISWMPKFQAFLDLLNTLGILETSDDPSIMYPVAMFSSDGQSWPVDDGILVTIIQRGMITVIVTDAQLRQLQFVDISTTSIREIQANRSTLIGSQIVTTEHGPWDLVLKLNVGPWATSMVTTRDEGTEITLVFQNNEDADECRKCIREHRMDTEGTHSQNEEDSLSRSGQMMRASYVDKNNKKELLQMQASTAFDRASGIAAASPRSKAVPLVTEESIGSKRPQRKTKSASKKAETCPTQEHCSSNPDDSLQSSNNPEKQSSSKSSSEVTSHSKGKLSRVSQVAKRKALKQLRTDMHEYDYSPEQLKNTNEAGKNRTHALRASDLSSDPKADKSTKRSNKSRPKRRSNHNDHDDDEYVPGATLSGKTGNSKRKSRSDIVVDDDKARKKVCTRHIEQTASETPITTDVNTSKQVAKRNTNKDGKEPKPRQPDKVIRSSSRAMCHTLITSLKGSKTPLQHPATPFKKPDAPARASQLPSTPEKFVAGQFATRRRPQTPRDINDEPSDVMGHAFASSPPVMEATGGQNRRRHPTFDTEILSSNSKPVPASPNADSTAISGHADCEDVVFEKERGDIQTAKSDPFRKQRAGSKPISSFLRRLTGDDHSNHDHSPQMQVSDGVISKVTSLSYANDGLLTQGPSLPQPIPWHRLTGADTDDMLNRCAPAEAETLRNLATFANLEEVERLESASSNQLSLPVEELQASSPSKRGVETGTCGTAHVAALKQVAHSGPREHNDELGNSILSDPRLLVDDTRSTNLAASRNDAQVDDEDTLVNHDEDDRFLDKCDSSPLHFCSSPFGTNLRSSHSSTSAGSDPQTPNESILPTSQAEEMEWEQSLQPHQRVLHDLLIRTSKHVLRHVIDNETAVTDITDVFSRDGEHVVNSLLQRHESDYKHVFKDMDDKKKGLEIDLERTAKRLKKESKRVQSMDEIM